MKYFKYWVKPTFKIHIGKFEESISILSGSNISKEHAFNKAQENSKNIEDRIKTGAAVDSYDAAIKEYVDNVIDEHNIITVCRYGAKVLNTSQYTILDLDQYPVNFMDRFKSLGKMSKKERIVYKFLERLKKNPELGSDFRIYETAKGIRVIGKKYISPSDSQHAKLMRKFFVDGLYVLLSEKQNCYRARLTPKPYRMKAKTIKIGSPLDCETEQYQQWASEYEANARRFSVVKLVQSIGTDFSRDPVIQLHDDMCSASRGYKLA